jgi:hypothetical protein
MRTVFKNLGIGFGIFALIVLIGTCTFTRKENPPPIQTDTSYMKVLKEKQAELQKEYSKQIISLKHAKDSLGAIIIKNKQVLIAYRYKSNVLERQLITLIEKSDSSRIVNDSIRPLAENYIDIQQGRDSICNQSTQALEILGAKKDSIIFIQKQEKDSFRELQKEQEQRALNLTEQLNTAYKQQRKTALKSRILAGTLILISGFTSALLINQTLK